MGLIAGPELDAVTYAGAFLLGAVFATIATIRVVRAVITLLSAEHRPDDNRKP